MTSMVPYGSSLEENIAYRIAAELSHVGPELFWVAVGRVFGLNRWYVWMGNSGDKDEFLTVTIDRRVRSQPLSWEFSFKDGVHENDSFSCPTLGPADVSQVIGLINNYIGMLY